MEQRRTNQSVSFTTAITKLPFQSSFVAKREIEGTLSGYLKDEGSSDLKVEELEPC